MSLLYFVSDCLVQRAEAVPPATGHREGLPGRALLAPLLGDLLGDVPQDTKSQGKGKKGATGV